jgi:hypothetical protein
MRGRRLQRHHETETRARRNKEGDKSVVERDFVMQVCYCEEGNG